MNDEDWRTKMIGLAVKSFPDNSYLCIANSISCEASIRQNIMSGHLKIINACTDIYIHLLYIHY